ncbi:hypothetical protein ACHAWC_003624 [Mediolabrus comicus]
MNPSKFAVALAAILLLDGTQRATGYCPTDCCPADASPKDFEFCTIGCNLPVCATSSTKSSKSPTATAPKSGKTGGHYGISEITSQQLASIQKANKSSFSFLIAGTMIVAAAAFLNIALKWAQKSRQARSINDLDDEEEAVDGFEDEFEDESNEQLRDVFVGEGVEVEIVEAH